MLLGQLLNKDPLMWALYGGEDYQLIGTVDVNKVKQFQDLFKLHFNKELYVNRKSYRRKQSLFN